MIKKIKKMIKTETDLHRQFHLDTGLIYQKLNYETMEYEISTEYVPWLEDQLLRFINQHLIFKMAGERLLGLLKEKNTMKRIFKQIGKLADKQFPKADAVVHLKKVLEETEEAIKCPIDMYEYADIFIAFAAAVHKAGNKHTPFEKAYKEQTKN